MMHSSFRKVLSICIGLFALASQVNGQEVLRLSMEEAITMAQEGSFDAYRGRYQYSVSELYYQDQMRSASPSLNFSSTVGNYTRAIQEQWDSENQRYLPFQVQRLYNYAGITLAQPLLFTGGTLNVSTSLRRNQTFAETGDVLNYVSSPVNISYSHDFSQVNRLKWGRKIGELEYQEATRNRVEAREAVALETIQRFYELVIAQNQLKIAELNKQNADSLFWMAKEKKAILAISRADFLKLELQRSDAEIALEKTINEVENLQSSFCVFLGVDLHTKIACEPARRVTNEFQINSQKALDKLFENNTDLLSIKRKLLETEQQVVEAKRSPYRLSVSGNVGLNQNKETLGSAYQDLLDQQGVSVTLSLPIYDGGANSRQVQRARLRHEYQLREARQTHQDLELEILRKVNDFQITSRQLDAYAKSDTLSTYMYQANKERFILGKATIIDMLDAEERRQNARINYLRQVQNYWVQYYTIRQLCLYDFINEQDLVIGE